MQDSSESGKSPFGRVSCETLSDAQWRERARWIDARNHILWPRFDLLDPWAARIAAARQWERTHV